MTSSVILEISSEDVSSVLESDDLLVELTGESVETVTVPTLDSLEIFTVGPQGPAGPAGASFVHTQTTPAATWTIVHNLNTVLSVVLLIDSIPGEPVFTDITYPDLNTVVVTWPSPETGKAYLR